MNWILFIIIGVVACGTDVGVDTEAPRGIANVVDCPVLAYARLQDRDGAGVADATVCVDGRADLQCAVSDDRGEFSLCVPADEYALGIDAPGMERALWPRGSIARTGLSDGDELVLHREADAASTWKVAGVLYPSTTTGYVRVEASWSPLGISLLRSGVPAIDIGDGRTYFAAVDPGSYDLAVKWLGGGARFGILCVPSVGWPSMRVPVIAGATTSILLHCGPT